MQTWPLGFVSPSAFGTEVNLKSQIANLAVAPKLKCLRHEDSWCRMKSRRSSNQSGLMCGCADVAFPWVTWLQANRLSDYKNQPERTLTGALNKCANTDACARIVIVACNGQPAGLIFASMNILPAAHCACASSARTPREREPVLVDSSKCAAGEDLRDWLHTDFCCWAPEPLSGYKMCDIGFHAVGVLPPAARPPEETF